MNTPALKYSALLSQVVDVINSKAKLTDIALGRLSFEADQLLKTDPVDANVIKMLIECYRANIKGVVGFGRMVEHSLPASSDPSVFTYNFLMALLGVGVLTDFGVEKYLSDLLAYAADDQKEKSSIIVLAYNFGLFDKMTDMIGGVEAVREIYRHGAVSAEGLSSILLWHDIKGDPAVNEAEFVRLNQLVRQLYVSRFGRPILEAGYEPDDSGKLFCYIYANEDVHVDALVDFNWDVEEMLEKDGSPLLKHLVFDTRY